MEFLIGGFTDDFLTDGFQGLRLAVAGFACTELANSSIDPLNKMRHPCITLGYIRIHISPVSLIAVQ